MKISLKNRLLIYLRNNPGWHAKGKLADLARESELKATGEHTGRRLRELEKEGEVVVKHIKNHAHYSYNSNRLTQEEWWDSLGDNEVVGGK